MLTESSYETMPLFQVDVEKRLLSEYFSNVYYLQSPTIASAVTDAGLIVAFERSIMLDNVNFTKQRVRTTTVGDDVYALTTLSGLGSRSSSGGTLPLFNTLNVVLSAVVGRPSRKYYRGVLQESDIDFTSVSVGLLGTVTTNANTLLTAMAAADSALVDIDNTGIFSMLPVSEVGMRQLRRGSKRRAQPILP